MMDYHDEYMVENEFFMDENVDSESAASMDVDDSSSEYGTSCNDSLTDHWRQKMSQMGSEQFVRVRDFMNVETPDHENDGLGDAFLALYIFLLDECIPLPNFLLYSFF
ncbi:hypothetical protein RMATCC62417_12959 [Rhizopus microsporus]|nr:hypothetical protein RMATCC62417_12959 [Rhizopus microsporus]